MLIWTDDDQLRDDCEQDAQLEKTDTRVCDQCGEPAERFFSVEDRDDSVGYRDVLEICEECIERLRRKR